METLEIRGNYSGGEFECIMDNLAYFKKESSSEKDVGYNRAMEELYQLVGSGKPASIEIVEGFTDYAKGYKDGLIDAKCMILEICEE
jgi:hypothetical protein